jgi:hypothetical protein
MSKATIEGKISPTGYLHLKYNAQNVDGELHTAYDSVVTPKDEKGGVSFTLPQGINVTIELYPAMNAPQETAKTVTIPKSETVALSALLK